MPNFYPAIDKSRECQYTGEKLNLKYFISNEGNFASYEGAAYEAMFEEVDLNGESAYVEGEAPDSGEFFVYVNFENVIEKATDGQWVLSVESMIQFIRENPLLDLIYIYDLASGADNFAVNEDGDLTFDDALNETVRLDESSNYKFYLDGLRLKMK